MGIVWLSDLAFHPFLRPACFLHVTGIASRDPPCYGGSLLAASPFSHCLAGTSASHPTCLGVFIPASSFALLLLKLPHTSLPVVMCWFLDTGTPFCAGSSLLVLSGIGPGAFLNAPSRSVMNPAGFCNALGAMILLFGLVSTEVSR